MAQVVNAGLNQIKLNDGSVITANQGGWYDGQQYWGGTLSAPGVINSLSNQQGAGQAVSSEVNAQSAAAQGVSADQFNNYLNEQRQILANASTPSYLSSRNIQNYTNSLQNGVYSNYSGAGIPGVQSTSDILNELKTMLPTNAPEAPNLVDTYKTLTSDSGITDLENQLNDLKAQREEVLGQLDVNKTAEKSKPVAQNVIEGRISEEEATAQQRVDFLTRQINSVSNELTSKYNTIEKIMQYTQTDYTNAKDTYDTQFSQAMDLITQARGIQQDQISVQQKAIDNARANLQIYVNAITSGNLDLSSASPDVIASINSMELQAGLPIGFMQSLGMSAKDQILHINDSTGEVLMTDGSGGFKVVQAMTGTSNSASSYRSLILTAASSIDTGYQTINGVMQESENSGDKRLSTQEYDAAFDKAWADSKNNYSGSRDDFITIFAKTLYEAGYSLWKG